MNTILTVFSLISAFLIDLLSVSFLHNFYTSCLFSLYLSITLFTNKLILKKKFTALGIILLLWEILLFNSFSLRIIYVVFFLLFIPLIKNNIQDNISLKLTLFTLCIYIWYKLFFAYDYISIWYIISNIIGVTLYCCIKNKKTSI